MFKSVQILLIVCITSLFFFPFFFSFLPGVNTKMILAVLGIFAYISDRLKGETENFEKGLWSIIPLALAVSFCSFLSMTINNTPDDSYLGYVVSMLVWLFAAYFCVFLMKKTHGEISVEIVGYYLLGVALLQCSLALLINNFASVKSLTDMYISGEKYMGVGVKNRLYGIGCALDVGGGRLGAILIVIAHLILVSIKKNKSKWIFMFLFVSFLLVLVIGNMMGRTATVGFAVALSYLICSLIFDNSFRDISIKSYLLNALIIIFFVTFICIILYNTNMEARKLIRFAFEGFFNYFELGTFETNSTNMLSRGMIFPDNLQTWIIGDGYMASGENDPYYIGPSDYGFYMNTDAGYSRFIFYFGLVGLITFILFFVNVCRVCVQKIESLKFLFFAILILNLAIWIKVSTDLFVVFAPFLCIGYSELESKNNIMDDR